MTVYECRTCGDELGPAESPECMGCGTQMPTTIGHRALVVLEQADGPLSYWDIQRLIERRDGAAPAAGSLLVYLSRDLRVCWAGRGMYGLYRHGLVPNVRGLGPAAEAHLLAAPTPIDAEQLHFVLQHQGYRYQYASLINALQRQLGPGGQLAAASSDAERTRREQRLAALLQISRRARHFQPYAEALTARVEHALGERARRLSQAGSGAGTVIG